MFLKKYWISSLQYIGVHVSTYKANYFFRTLVPFSARICNKVVNVNKCEIRILARNVVPLVHSALTKRQRSQQSAVLAMTMASKAAPSIKAVEPILFRW